MADIKQFADHPFKEGIRMILSQHFAPKIVLLFDIYFEVEMYNLDSTRSKNLLNQLKDGKFIAEVYFTNEKGLSIYICDLYSWWPKKQVEYVLLQHITDKARTGQIGRDWTEKDIKNISGEVRSGKYETPDEEITKYMPKERRKN